MGFSEGVEEFRTRQAPGGSGRSLSAWMRHPPIGTSLTPEQTAGQTGTWTSAPIPKFASLCSTVSCELRNQRSTSNLMILVWLLNLKFLDEVAATLGGTSNSPH